MNGVTIVLPEGIAASGIAYDGEYYYACDGFRNTVFSFDINGKPACNYCSMRPYLSIRYDPFSSGFIAVGGGCGHSVYFLDDEFRELGVLSAPGGGGGTVRYVGVSVNGAMLDITYDCTVIRSARNGEYVSTVKVARRNTDFLGYDEYTEGSALASESGGAVTVSVNGLSARLPACTSFRGFLPFADRMYLAVGYRYLYTYIFEVARGANADFSRLESGIFGSNTGTGCCNI